MKKLISVILALALILSCLPLSAAAKEASVEQKFKLLLEDMEITYRYHQPDRCYYAELQKGDGWVLIRAGMTDQNPQDGDSPKHYAVVGNKLIAAHANAEPFKSGYGVYDTHSSAFYDLTDAWGRDFSGLHDAWNAMNADTKIAYECSAAIIGDADQDGVLTILDATRIQRILAELNQNPFSMVKASDFYYGYPIGSTIDFDRDGSFTILDATKIQRSLADLPNNLETKLAFDLRTYHSADVGKNAARVITSAKELDDFYRTYGENPNTSDPNWVSRDDIAGYTDAYLKNKMLIGCYVYLASGSYRLRYQGAKIDIDGTLDVSFTINGGGIVTDDINERFILIETSKAFMDDINNVLLNVTVEEESYSILKEIPFYDRISATAPNDLNSGGYQEVAGEKLTISAPYKYDYGFGGALKDIDTGYVLLLRGREDIEHYLPEFDTEKKLDDAFFKDYAVLAMLQHGGADEAYATLSDVAVSQDGTLWCSPQIDYHYLYIDGVAVISPTDPVVWTFLKVRQSEVKDVKSLNFWKAHEYDPDTLFVTQITDDKKVAEGTYGDALPYNSLSTSTRVFTWDYQKYGDGADFLNQPYRVAIIRSYDQYEAFFSSDHFEGIDDYAYKPINYYPLDDVFFWNNALIIGVGYFCTGDEYLFFDEIRQSDDGEVLTVRFNRYTYGDLHPYEPYAANILGYCFAAASVPKDTVKYVSAVQMLPQVKKLPDDVYSRMEYGILYNETGDFYTNFSEENEAYYVTSPQELTTAIDALMVDEVGEHIMRGSYRFPVEDTAAYGDAWFAEYDMIAARVYKGGSNTRLYVTDLERSAAGNLRLECTKLHDEYDTPDNTWNFIFLSVEKQEKKPKITIEVIDEGYEPMPEKPIIYLYPEEETELTVTLGKPEELTCTYPAYNDGWHVTAKPDGTLIDDTGRSYYSLYWESKSKTPVRMTDGFVVKGEDTAKFFEEKLAALGLTEREAQEFIVYWLPQMQDNEYNLIRFATSEEIEEIMPLSFSVQPDTVIRVLMEYTPLDEYIEVTEQELPPTPERKGFVAVEWGGTRIG